MGRRCRPAVSRVVDDLFTGPQRWRTIRAADVLPPVTGVSHRFVLTVPIVPFVLNYEGEVALDGKVNLQAAWQRLLAKVRR